MKCRICGCTDNNACIGVEGPCYWVEDDLCSACAEDEQPLVQLCTEGDLNHEIAFRRSEAERLL
jgi:hypothetical protein